MRRSGSQKKPVRVVQFRPFEKCASRRSTCSSHMAITSTEAKVGRSSLDIDGPVARIKLRNPPFNVIDVAMMEELSRSLAEIEARQDLSIIVLSGEGKAFSVGVDVAAHTPDKVEEMLAKFHSVIRALDRKSTRLNS